MLKQIIIISIFSSFCFGHINLTETQAKRMTNRLNALEKKIDDQNDVIQELKETIETLASGGSNLGTTEKSADNMITTIEDSIKSYKTNIADLLAEINKTNDRKEQLEDEMEIHQKYRDELDAMRVDWEKKLSELADKHRDVTNFRDEMEVILKSEPTGTLDEEQGE